MIFISAPLRISFLGGGTDFPGWFKENVGGVISTTINQYVHVMLSELAPIWGTKYKFSYSKIETVSTSDEIQHPLIRTCVKEYAKPDDRLSILYSSDLPGNSGLGSSSAFCGAMILGINEYKKQEKFSRMRLAEEAIRVERELLSEAGGWQDQIATAYGGFNHIKFFKSSFEVTPLSQKFIQDYLENCYLIHVGKLRKAHEVSKAQISSISEKQKLYKEMHSLIEPALYAIALNDFDEFSGLIDRSWELKRFYSDGVSNSEIDAAIQRLRNLGGTGIKLLGAGSGGFLLCRFKSQMSAYHLNNVGFEYSVKIAHATDGVRRLRLTGCSEDLSL